MSPSALTTGSSEKGVLKEFTNITNNVAYIRAFNNRVMRRDPTTGSLIGNDQRKLFLPHLFDLIQSKKSIVDVGAGAGEILDDIHPFIQGATFYLEEPNPMLLNEYKERLCRYNLRIGEASTSTVQEYLKTKGKQPLADCILSLHMIYHLTDFTAMNINPEADLRDLIVNLYGLLMDGGSIFLVYADLEKAYAGKIAVSYFATPEQRHYHANLKTIYRVRNEILRERGILSSLQALYPQDTITMDSIVCNSQFYGDSIHDLAAMSLVGELIESNDEPFDIGKLKHALRVLKDPTSGIRLVRGEHMWSANEEQVICIIRKNSSR